MTWPIATINDWKHFEQFASHLTVGRATKLSYAFRGQADADWLLNPSLLRYLSPHFTAVEALELEKSLTRIFREQAHLHIDLGTLYRTNHFLDWWALMQHYGAPTRLLDWTASAYVALYFAVEQLWDRDGAIWFVHVNDLRSHMNTQYGDVYQKSYVEMKNEFLNPEAVLSIQPWLPQIKSERMVAQQGLFLVSPQVLADHSSAIDLACSGVVASGDVYQKVIIPRTLKPVFLMSLRAMNITAGSLFPGIDGLGKTIAEAAKLDGRGRQPDAAPAPLSAP